MKKNINIFVIIITAFLTIVVLGLGIVIGLNIQNYNKKDTINNNKTNNNSKKEESNEEEYEITYNEEVEEYKNNKGVIIFKNKRRFPISDSLKLTNILDEVKKMSNKNWNEANSTAKSMIDDGYGENLLNVNEILGVDIELKLEFSNDKIITFTQIQEGSFGGVSWPDIKGYNFSLETKKLLNIKDITTNINKLTDKVYLYSKNYIENEYNEGLHDIWEDELKDNLFKNNNWILTKNYLYIALEKYLIADGATGVIDIEIPYSEINYYLKEEYKG